MRLNFLPVLFIIKVHKNNVLSVPKYFIKAGIYEIKKFEYIVVPAQVDVGAA